MLGTAAASFLVCAVFRLVPCQASVSPYFYFTRIMTTGFFMALSFQSGNTAYLYLTVAFVQMLKAFTPVSTMLCGFMFRLERPSAKLIAAVSCICLGVIVSSYGEVNFSWFGVAAMLTSVAAEGLRLVMMQHLLAAKQFHPLEAWMYLAPACTIWLVLLIGVFEIHHINDQHGFDIILQHHWYFVFAALAGFAVNTLAMLVIKLASALTLKVLGIGKDIGLVLAGVMFLAEHVTVLQVVGYSVSLVGCTCYNYIKAMSLGGQELQDQSDKQQQQQGAKLGSVAKSQRSISSRVKQGLIGATGPRSGGLTDPLLPKALPPPAVLGCTSVYRSLVSGLLFVCQQPYGSPLGTPQHSMRLQFSAFLERQLLLAAELSRRLHLPMFLAVVSYVAPQARQA
eukprot:gene4300-4552_t